MRERLERDPMDRKQFGKQGLLPALAPGPLKTAVVAPRDNLDVGPVGQSRCLANFILHAALVRNAYSGAALMPGGRLKMPMPNLPSAPVFHWYTLEWPTNRANDLDGAEFGGMYGSPSGCSSIACWQPSRPPFQLDCAVSDMTTS